MLQNITFSKHTINHREEKVTSTTCPNGNNKHNSVPDSFTASVMKFMTRAKQLLTIHEFVKFRSI